MTDQKPKPIGRPTKFDAEKAQTICALLQNGNFLSDAAAFVGVSTNTVEGWIEKGKKATAGEFAQFASDVAKARAIFSISATKQISGGRKNSKDLQWLLSKLQPKKFGDRVRVHVEQSIEEILAKLEAGLDGPTFERVIEVLGGAAGAGPAGEDTGSSAAEQLGIH
jgi:hypothetical protein